MSQMKALIELAMMKGSVGPIKIGVVENNGQGD